MKMPEVYIRTSNLLNIITKMNLTLEEFAKISKVEWSTFRDSIEGLKAISSEDRFKISKTVPASDGCFDTLFEILF